MFLDEDSRVAAQAGKILIVVCFLFVFSCYKSCEEVKFRLSGQVTEATFTGINKQIGRRGREYYSATYVFRVDGKNYQGDIEVEPQDEIPATLQIAYLPGDPMINRLVGSGNWVWIGLLLFFLAAGVVFGIQTWKQAVADIAASKR